MSAKTKRQLGDIPTRISNGGRPNGNGTPPHRVTDIQRARILAAMAEMCAERGAANVTVAHIVGHAGVSRRTFYEQFGDREDCFLAALDEALRCVAAYVLPAYEADGGWRERMRAALAALLAFLEDELYMGRLLIVETLSGSERALRLRQEVLVHVCAAVDEGRLETKPGAALPPLTAEAAVGGVLSILHSRLLDKPDAPLLGLISQLMSMIVVPYMGAAAAQRELRRPAPKRVDNQPRALRNPLHDLEMRLTYRTVRVLLSIDSLPGASNRELGMASEVNDQGQISKLLTRLEKLGLVENTGIGHARGGPNAWVLTERGKEVQQAVVHRGNDLVGA